MPNPWKIGDVSGARSERELEVAADIQVACQEWMGKRLPKGSKVSEADGWTEYEDLECGNPPICARAMIIAGAVCQVDIRSRREVAKIKESENARS